MPLILKIVILALIQGAAELLPVSSSAHVIVAEKLMGLNPTSPEMTLLLVMLHTGTMFAVIFFFWNSWKRDFSIKLLAAATFLTALVGLALKFFIEKIILRNTAHAEIEHIFGNLSIISAALAAVGILILFAGWKARQAREAGKDVGFLAACVIGAVQGICLPFRGFSRSGATISTGLILGASKKKVEDFSFALAVILTPPVIARETLRLLKSTGASSPGHELLKLFMPSFFGMILSFISGYLALRWLSNWLEKGKWHLFGLYCIWASIVVFVLHSRGL